MAELTYLQHKDIDFAEWDACVRAAQNGLIYGESAYLNIICPTWEAIVSYAPSGKYETILPVPARMKFGIRYVSQPYLCQQLGVYSRLENVAETWLEEALTMILKRFSYCNRYFGFSEKVDFERLLHQKNVQVKTYKTHLLPFDKSYSELHKNFATDRKQNLARAKNTGWTIVQSADFEDLVRLHQEHNELKAVGRNLPIERYRPYINLVNDLIKKQQAELYFAQKDGRIEAGCLFVYSGKRIIYLFNGASPAGRKQHGRLLILNQIFEKYANQDYVFDFEDPTEAPEVSAYYASFNCQKETFIGLTWMHLPKPINWLLALRRKWF